MPSDFSCTTVKRNLRFSVGDGLANSLAVGLGEGYLVAFAIALGFSTTAAALLSTLPLLVGGILQLLSPWFALKLGSFRRWVLFSTGIQGLSFIPFAYFAKQEHASVFALYGVAAVYWASGMAANPAWNAWLNELIPKRIRTGFFSKRTLLTNLGALLGLVVGGALLGHSSDAMNTFCFIFLACGALRLTSTYFLYRHTESPKSRFNVEALSLPAFIKGLKSEEHGRILLYLLLMQIAVQVSSSFVTPYMLVHLKLSYDIYMVMLVAAFLGRIVTYPLLKVVADRWGVDRLFVISSVLVAPLPVFWLFGDHVVYLFLLQFVSGVVWGAQDLSAFLVLFNRIPQRQRMTLLCSFNFLNTMAFALGSGMGAVVFHNSQNLGFNNYFLVFGLSAALRAFALQAMPGLRIPTLRLAHEWIFMKTLGLRANSGAISGAIVADLDPEPESEQKQTSDHSPARADEVTAKAL